MPATDAASAGASGTPAPAAPATSTPVAPATSPPSPPAAPTPEPSSAGPQSGAAVNEPAAGSTSGVEPPAAEDSDVDEAGVLPSGSAGPPVNQAGLLEGVAAPGMLSGLAQFLTRDAPNYKADIVIFVSLLTLALAGLWIEWRLPGRRTV